VTQLEIDTMRSSVDEMLQLFRDAVLPGLKEQSDYRGVLAMSTPEGQAVLVSLWATEQAAESHAEGTWYSGVLAEFATFFSSPPGRDHYEVLVTDLPAAVS
jgi:hypothetical protein